jgi:drug/metabolite transporter (DMT)-like permease
LSDQSVKVSFFRSKAGGYILLTVLSIIWGLAFVAIRYLDLELTFVDLTLLRWFVASAGYVAVFAFVGRTKNHFERRDFPRLLVVAFFNVVGYHLSLNYAEKTVSSGIAGLLISLGPVFSAVLAVSFLKEKVSARLGLAIVLALVGAVILSMQDVGEGFASISGPLAVVISAFSYAAFGVFSKPLVSKYGALSVAGWAGVLGTCMLLPLFSSTFMSDVAQLSSVGWASLLYLSLLSTVMGYAAFYTLVGRGGVLTLMVQLYLAPVVSVVGGIILLGESLTAFTLMGGSAMLIAVWLATSVRKS